MFHVKRNKTTKKVIPLLIVLNIFITPIQVVASSLNIDANAVIIADKTSGSILYEENYDKVLGIASITKLMSIYIVFEEMERQKIELDTEVSISARVAQLKGQMPNISGVWLQEGEIITVDELINLSLIFSDNGATIQLAEFTSGSEKQHVQKMNEQAESWGLRNTKFYNVTGLTNGDYGDIMILGSDEDEYNVSTAKEVAFLAKKVVDKYPNIINYTSTPVYNYKNDELYNYNLLLPGLVLSYEGIVGLKTGTSLEAKSCFVSLFLHEGEEYITVVLGADDTIKRFEETKKMLDYIKKQNLNTKISSNEEVLLKIDSTLNYGEVSLYPKENVTSFNSEGVNLKLNDIVYSSEYFDEDNKLTKTIPKGEVVVSYVFENILDNGSVEKLSSSGNEVKVEMISKEDVLYQGWFLDAIDHGVEFFVDMYSSILKV